MKKSTLIQVFLTAALILIVSCSSPVQKVGEKLPRSIPEKEGVDSKGIIDFIKSFSNSSHELHSFIFLRHGKVVAEAWWAPYAPDLKHTLYSTSKSFTSTAIGFAVAEKKIKVTDKVISFFPEYLPDTISKNLADMEVRDLLSMTAGQDPDPTVLIPANDSNWIKGFLARPVINDPGTKFLYNSMATYMLSAIVQKATGEKVLDYLTPRLFRPLSIEGIDWETDPMGINTGGWGLRVKTEDLAKFGQFYLQKGNWNGEQLLPVSWIKEATSFKIDQAPGSPDSIRNKSDWQQGYCYQFWRCRNNAFRGDGAFGQYIIVMPEKDAVIAITSETSDMQDEINHVWDYLLPSLKDKPLPENSQLNDELIKLIGSLSVKLPEPGIENKLTPGIEGKIFLMSTNDWNLESMSFTSNGDVISLKMRVKGEEHTFIFGKDKWEEVMTTMHGPNLLGKARNQFAGMPPVKVAGIYRWREKNKLELTLRFIESPHSEIITCDFNGKKISISREISFMKGYKLPEIGGISAN